MLPHIIIFNASDSLREACFKQWTCHEIGARFFLIYVFDVDISTFFCFHVDSRSPGMTNDLTFGDSKKIGKHGIEQWKKNTGWFDYIYIYPRYIYRGLYYLVMWRLFQKPVLLRLVKGDM